MRKLLIPTTLLLSGMQAQATDWTDLYGLTEPANLPQEFFSKTEQLSASTMVTADLYVDLSKALFNPQIGVKKPATIVIVADTVEIPGNFVLNLKNQSLFIYARRIIGSGSGTISLDGGTGSTELVGIFAGEVSASLNTVAFFPDGSYNLDTIGAHDAGSGEMVTVVAGQHQKQTVSGDISGYLQQNLAGHQEVFEKAFDMAASIYDQNPALSISMLAWVEKSLRASPVVLEQNPSIASLYTQAANLRQFVEFANRGTNYVPYLDRDLYQTTYAGYLDTMQDYQGQFERFSDQSQEVAVRKADAERMLANINDAMVAETAITNQARQNIAELRASLSTINDQFADQDVNVFTARSAFLVGLENWKTEQELQVAFQVFSTIASLGKAIGGAFAGSIDGLADLAASIPGTATQLTELSGKISDVATVLENVDSTSRGVSALTKSTESDVRYTDIATSFENLNFSIPSLHESNNAWEVLLIDVKDQLTWAYSLGIEEARPYLAELEKLIVYGKSINAVQIELAQEQSRLVELLIAAEVNKNRVNRIETLIADIDNDASALAELETTFHRALNSLKRPMFVALANYEAAFNYWGLTRSTVTPSLNKSYLDYKLDLATLNSEYALALNSFSPSPQNFYVNNIEITDAQQIADFVADGALSVNIAQDHPAFSLFDRVRLDTVRVILQGEELPTDVDYFIDINNNGEYQDRWMGNQYTFNANPLYRLFGYRLGNDEVSIITDASIADKFEFAYFEPTPFSTWSLALRNPGSVDLSKVESIRLEFSGNAIPKVN
ncbi:hypothetical protein SG34_003170 [Thalassomonas viridans]|uniref:Tc toxin complex TcA C-terminal TcB-binding domain-containing protein n=1 Tax=Thalassomonas viridans TaxID=137584 RepID=A0AAE9Z397_9GAMM|nr:hypothetical protein [Thalassomonas viridans]WDE05946.1 hypothetical protein SG34_003170 [Thalassomonas viridans]